MEESLHSLRKKYSQIDQAFIKNEKLIAQLEKDVEGKNKLYLSLQDKNRLLEQENEKLKKQVVSTYTPEDLSRYFNQTIHQFNTDSQSDTDTVRYMMSNIDVDLKAHIYADENGNMKCASPMPSATGEGSLSTIKFSIRAVPKQSE